jgi:hypothetical protein
MNEAPGTMPSQTPDPNPNPNSSPTPDPSLTPDPSPELDENGNPKPLISGEPKTDPEPVEFVPLTAADITIPEGLEVNEALVSEALTIVNNRELSPKDQLQGLIDLQAKLAKEASEGISKTWEDTQKRWQDEVKADPTIGGDKLPTTLAAVNKLVGEYGSPELVEAFALTGAGNNVHVIKFLNNVAGKLLEGSVVSATSPANQEEDRAARMFPSMKG